MQNTNKKDGSNLLNARLFKKASLIMRTKHLQGHHVHSYIFLFWLLLMWTNAEGCEPEPLSSFTAFFCLTGLKGSPVSVCTLKNDECL